MKEFDSVSKSEALELLQNKGYTATLDGGVLMIFPKSEEERKDAELYITKELKYNYSWGIKKHS